MPALREANSVGIRETKLASKYLEKDYGIQTLTEPKLSQALDPKATSREFKLSQTNPISLNSQILKLL